MRILRSLSTELRLTLSILALVVLTPIYADADGSIGPTHLNPASTSNLSLNKSIRIVSWNYGYAGSHAETKELDVFNVPPEKIEENSRAIAEFLSSISPDIILLQEAAPASNLTQNVDTLSVITESFPDYSADFAPTMKSSKIVSVLVGNATLARYDPWCVETYDLRPATAISLIPVHHNMLVARFKTDSLQDLVVANVHLSAYDKDGEVRLNQLNTIVNFARDEYKSGNYVIVGGGWNLQLVPTNFPHSTPDDDLWWLVPLPKTIDLPDWTWVVDSDVPTSRAVHTPYVFDQTFTTILDGFLVSPNVRVDSSRTEDLGFQHAHYNPTIVEVVLE